MTQIPLSAFDASEKVIAERIYSNDRLSEEEALFLFEKTDLATLAYLASYKNSQLHGKKVYYNVNFHLEPTNICVYQCKFCSYYRKKNDPQSWEHSLTDIVNIIRQHNPKATEIHIVGGVHPDWDIDYYCLLLETVKKNFPHLHVKALTAVEIDYIAKKSGITIKETLQRLQHSGLKSLPGGGAEIFNPRVRNVICKDKADAERWLEIHETAHSLGMKTNATILYGHIESYAERVEHMSRLRSLQDKTKGFNAFIPLKYRNANNALTGIDEVNYVEDMKNFAISRLFLDNIPHLKAYWPMLGTELAQLSLSFGVNDLDGTIEDSTKIYSMAGVKEKQGKSQNDIVDLIQQAGKIAVERDSLYNELKIHS